MRKETPVAEYVAGIRREIEIRFADAGRWDIETLYLGGGTPSRLGADGVMRLLEVLRERITIAADAEITLEANPDDVTPDVARAWRDAGITRLSIGAQSFDERVLQWMHRTHTASATERAVHWAREAGFDNLSLDLIFALPTELGRAWSRDLECALQLDPDHLSIYGLTVESTTPLGRWVARAETHEAPEEHYAAEFLHAHDTAAAAGYEHYEVSNYAKAGRRARHNGSYWSGATYGGLGPAAHEYDGAHRRWNVPGYVEWGRRLVGGVDPVCEAETLSAANRVAERVYLELRTSGGTILQEGELPTVRRWANQGWATLDGERLTLTPRGWLVLDSLAATLTDSRSH